MPKQHSDTWLRFHREDQGLSQQDLADATGISKVSLNRFERGHRRPAAATAERIADALGLEVWEVFPRNGKTPHEAARLYLELVRARRDGQSRRPTKKRRRRA